MTTILRLLARGDEVVGLDNLNDYYSVQLKLDRLARLTRTRTSASCKLDVADRAGMAALFAGALSTASSTWRRRPACAIRCRTRMPTSTATSSAS
jgi:nucleoside-diphosphate-sugar epimerase